MAQTIPAAIARSITLSSPRSRPTLGLQYRTQSRHPFSSTAPFLRDNTRKADPNIKYGHRDTISTTANPDKKSRKGSGDSPVADELDFSPLQAAITQTVETLQGRVSKLQKGGMHIEAIEELPVSLDKGRGPPVKLEELAHVLARGRVLMVVIGNIEHCKPILSALNNSPNSLAPTSSPDNPLCVHIKAPPMTGESRRAIIDTCAEYGETAKLAISKARLDYKKKMRQLELSKSVRPDVLYKVGGKMEKLVKEGMADVKKIIDASRVGL